MAAFAVGTAHAKTLDDVLTRGDIGKRLRPLARSFGRDVARSIPVLSASSGVQYRYDYDANSYVREVTAAGELFVERADPMGLGRWDLSVAYQHIRFDRYGGEELEDLSDRRPIVAGRTPLLSIPHDDIAVDIDSMTFNAIYGLSERLDVSVAIPVLWSSLGIHETFRTFPTDAPQNVPVARSADSVGPGDVVLRSKLRLLARESLRVSSGISVTLPSGSEADFQGAGATAVTPQLFVSSAEHELGHGAVLEGHANLGMLFDVDDLDHSEGRWAFAADLALGGRASLGMGLLGRDAVGRLFPSGALDYRRCLSPTPQCRDFSATSFGPKPLFGFNGSRPDYLNLSVGGRVSIWRDSVIAFANVLVPLLDEGLTTDPIPTVGIEVSM